MTWDKYSYLNEYIPLEDQPVQSADIPDYLQWIHRGWMRLNVDRPWIGGGMSAAIPLPIPWTMIVTWSEYHHYNEHETMMFDICCRAMDKIFIEYHSNKQQEVKSKI